jgi:DNA repair exonuclease SbcCD ATPase subunit
MRTIQDLHGKIFSECQNMLSILQTCGSAEDLLKKQNLIAELSQKVAFLRDLKQHSEDIFNEDEAEHFYQESQPEIIEEEKFESQIHDIVENEFHEALVSSAQEESLDEILTENEDYQEENVAENHFSEETASEEQKNEQELIQDQLNEIDEFENEISDTDSSLVNFEEEELIVNNYETTQTEKEEDLNAAELEGEVEKGEERYNQQHDEMFTENSNIENLMSSIKDEPQNEEPKIDTEVRGTIKDIQKEKISVEKEVLPSDDQFEDLDAYQREKKIRLANIKGLKSIQSLFDDDHLDGKTAQTAPKTADSGSILKTNIPTEYMEAEKQKPEFRLDLNDRMAFTKMLFNGSQADLNEAVTNLNRCRNIEEAKEYLSDLYYDKKWDKVDDYAQRLWILVENKFL